MTNLQKANNKDSKLYLMNLLKRQNYLSYSEAKLNESATLAQIVEKLSSHERETLIIAIIGLDYQTTLQ